jgi:hypothetical protein
MRRNSSSGRGDGIVKLWDGGADAVGPTPDAVGTGVSPSPSDAVAVAVGDGDVSVPGSIGFHVATRTAPIAMTRTATSHDIARLRGVRDGGPADPAGPPDGGPSASVGGPADVPPDPSGAGSAGVGIRMVGVSSPMSRTVYGRVGRDRVIDIDTAEEW